MDHKTYTVPLSVLAAAASALSRLFNDAHPSGKGAGKRAARIAAIRNAVNFHVDEKSAYAIGRKHTVDAMISTGECIPQPNGMVEFSTYLARERFAAEMADLQAVDVELSITPLALDDLDELNMSPTCSPEEVAQLLATGVVVDA